ARGHRLTLVTDARGARFAGWFENIDQYVIPAGRFAGAGKVERVKALGQIVAGIWRSWRLLRKLRPVAVVGFGGYPSLPVMAAAWLAGVPSCLHEQNAVLGRVNRFVLRWADALALSFRETRGAERVRRVRLSVTGNPVRRDVSRLFDQPFNEPEQDGVVRLLVLGGSQGAQILSDVVPGALSVLSRRLRQRIQVIQQCRREDIDRVFSIYRDMGVDAELATFLEDIPARLEAAHFVVARAGASTVCEIAAAGLPSVLVPLPGATDDHQTANARELERAGAAWLMQQQDFTAGELAKRIRILLTKPHVLVDAARQAREVAKPRAAEALADLVEWLARVRHRNGLRERTSGEDSAGMTKLRRVER
ncbi:MAG: undecaprenyldiphospho-muramoylpentapeptide beta-N-acetylglucosaminyltransferase, partial [Sphingomonadales bacterium]